MKRLLGIGLVLAMLAGLAVAQEKGKEDKDKKEKKEDKDVKDKGKDKDKVPPPGPDELKDLEAMSGTFVVIVFERDGRKEDAERLKKMKVVQTKATWKFHDGDEVTQGVDRVFPDKKPKEVDSTYTSGSDKGKTVLGIYAIEGEVVKFCWAEPGKPRPKEFATKAGADQTLMVLRRAKEGDFPKEKDKDKDKGKDKDGKDKGKDKDAKKDKDDKDKGKGKDKEDKK